LEEFPFFYCLFTQTNFYPNELINFASFLQKNSFSCTQLSSYKIYLYANTRLLRIATTGEGTPVRTDLGAPRLGATASNLLYFVIDNQLWKSDGTEAGTTQVNLNFEVSNEFIINLLGGGNSAYIITQTGNTARTYCITPQGNLKRVNLARQVNYSQPFVSKGVQYIFAHDSVNAPATCPNRLLMRYGQTEAQTQVVGLLDKKSDFCGSSLHEPVPCVVSEDDVLYYNLYTPALGNELWKVDLKTNPTTTTLDCPSKAVAPWELWISQVKLGTIQHASDKVKDIATTGFSDYRNLSTELVKGQSYPIEITPSLSWIGNLPHAYCRVWIDFNKNNEFEANELVLEKAGQNPLSQTFTVPANAVIGATKMRISLKWDGYPTACETFARGEVEDYTVNLTNPVTTPTTYCASKGTPWELWISQVQLGALNNPSTKFKDIQTVGFSDYTHLSTELAKGQNYPLSVTPSLSWIGNLPHAYCRAWIDFNKNNVFETNELVLEKVGQSPFNQNIIVPANATVGATRMRISVKWDAYATACDTVGRGEVEDYMVNISNTIPPTQARSVTQNLQVAVVQNQVRLDWLDYSEKVAYYEVEKPTDDGLNFKSIHKKTVGATENYFFGYDPMPLEGLNQYRLKSVWKDGTIHYTPLKTIDYQRIANFEIFPNPTKEEALIDLKDFADRKVELSISDVAGKVILTQTIENASVTPYRLPIETLGTGTYFVTVQTNGKRSVTRKLQIL
ncbi:MAG: hypothetical protein RLZZ628_2700, partial [Bacteroidota bacterium]